NGISTNNLGGTRTYASLVVTNGMTLRNTSVTHTVILGDTVVTGGNVLPSRLWLEGVKGTTLTTQNLTLQDGAVADLDGAFVRVNDRLTVDGQSSVVGHGVIDFWDSGATLINNGVIRAGGGNPLHFRQFGGGLYDLDGTNAAGAIDLSTHADARLRLQGTGLTDSFSGRITMRGGARLD